MKTTRLLFILLIAAFLQSCTYDVLVNDGGGSPPQASYRPAPVPNMGYPADNRYDTGHHGRFVEGPFQDPRYGGGYQNGQQENPDYHYVTPPRPYGGTATSYVPPGPAAFRRPIIRYRSIDERRGEELGN